MGIKKLHGNYISIAVLAVAALCALGSVFMPSSSVDTEGMAKHVDKRIEQRMARLDQYSAELLGSEARENLWPELKNLPEDMVIYRYAADTLHSWYNLYDSMPVMEDIPDYPVYRKFGRRWYLVKQVEKDSERILEGFLVRDERQINVEQGQNGISSHMHLHGKYDIAPLESESGAVVRLAGSPVFKIVVSNGQTDTNPMAAAGLRWLSLVLMLISGFVFLRFNRSPRNSLYVVLLVVAAMTVALVWGVKMSEYSLVFSPTLYANDGLLSSFGALLIINAAIFLCCLAVFMCRDFVIPVFTSGKKRRVFFACVVPMAIVLVTAFVFYTLASIIMNSSITLELYRINIVSWYTLVAYVSYAFVIVSVLLLCEIFLGFVNAVKGSAYTMLRWPQMLGFSTVASLAILAIIMVEGFRKEENRVAGWSNRLAVDRDLGIELTLRGVEQAIQEDEVLDMLCHSQNAEHIILRRLEDGVFGRLAQQCVLSVNVSSQFNPELRSYMEGLIADGVSIGPGSHFIYNRNSTKGSYYTGVFSYYSKEMGVANLMLEVVPRFTQGVQMPPTYSYAKYELGRLNSFSGNYAYPTVLDGLISPSRQGKNVFVAKGYRHFVNRLNDDETIVISRREDRMTSYFVTFTYLLFLLSMIAGLFRRRARLLQRRHSYFSRRMITLVIVSLTVTLVVMASVSVIFVYQRNERNLSNTMSSKISAIQILLDGACRQVSGPEELQNADFMKVLDDVSKSNNTQIDVYSPQGRLLISNSYSPRRRGELNSLISPEAYRSICLDHQRYYISQNPRMRFSSYTMYAPIINAAGKIVAITASSYLQRDYDFTRDAVFHAATVISLFIILLLITVLIASSIIQGIFRPLLKMGEKMKETDAQNLEALSYEGDDEISALVVAYNTMVHDLQESTGKLAAAERDKAWSEMARQVAHEIKNPLTPIKLEIQRLQRLKMRNVPDWEEKFDNVSAVILEHIDILSQTANEFSTFAKLYSEPSTAIDLDKTLKEQLMLFENRGVPFTYLGAGNAVVMGPRPQLIRVFVNLLTNALQAVEGVENPKIMVSLRKSSTDGMWDVVIEDNGPGVSEENQSKLFTPNFTTKSSGTGLGLAICRSIVDRCGGTISYSRSFALGGACFTVSLPA